MKESVTKYNTMKFEEGDCFNKPNAETLIFQDPDRDEALKEFAEIIKLGQEQVEE
jgi:hypothetical protein